MVEGTHLITKLGTMVEDGREGSQNRVKRGDIQWLDLQLPLYRQRLLEDGAGEVEVGYILLPQHLKKTRVDPLSWDPSDFELANECVDEILRHLSVLQINPLTDAELEEQGTRP